MRYGWLSLENAYVFRITHIRNVRWILDHGLYCRNGGVLDPDFVTIGDPELIDRREGHSVPVSPGGNLADYIPFYFTPFSPMAYKIKTGHGVPAVPSREIVILAASLRHLATAGVDFVFTDRHALLATATFLTSLDELPLVDWEGIRSRDFKSDVGNPDKTERYQAEALVHRCLPVGLLEAVVCHGSQQKALVDGWATNAGAAVHVTVSRELFF